MTVACHRPRLPSQCPKRAFGTESAQRYNSVVAMNIKSLTQVVLLGSAVALVIAPRTAFSQQPSWIGESCDLRVFGVAETAGFLTFDRDLRHALSKQDAGSLALLVRFPLRINGDRGSWYVNDARPL